MALQTVLQGRIPPGGATLAEIAVCNDSAVAVLPDQPSGNSSGVSAVSAIGAGGERRTAVFAIAPAAGSSPQNDIGPLVTHKRPAFTAEVAASSTFASS
jgi:hypothetical protein